jgi:para-aminobenzoate synthetase component 1
MRVVPLALRRDPLHVLAALAAEPGAFLVSVPDPARALVLLGCRPRAVLRVEADGTPVRSDGGPCDTDPLVAIEAFVRATGSPDAAPFPLGGGAVGFLGYELGGLVHGVAGAPGTLPLAVLAHYDPLLVFDGARGQYALVCRDAESARAAWLERLAAPVPTPAAGPIANAPLAALLAPDRHRAGVRRILDYLAAGDAYQVNLTQPFAAPLAVPAARLFAELATGHPVPHATYLDVGDAQLVSNSPELYLRRRGARVETHPIKGTRPRGDTPARDAALAAELQRDPKERAEHVMIVDLERNDLGRVAEVGSVVVEAHAELETHPTVHHLVSRVAARVRPEVGLAELLRATFPGGSITGAPKRRAMEIIAELEAAPRGPYTGAVGFFAANGDVELALAIRTAVVQAATVRWGAGGGIVAESDPERELAECWLKTAALRRALGEDGDGVPVSQCSSG